MTTVHLGRPSPGVVLLTLNDPPRRNAMGERMRDELLAAVAGIRRDERVRAVVVTGAGGAFCAGADLPALFGDPDRSLVATREALKSYYRAFLAVLELPQPTVAAVNGPAVGAGLNLALACDVRIAGPKATFGVTFTRIGLHPGGGCTWFLVRALGQSRALRTLLLGDTLDATRAVDWGLADGPEDDAVDAAVELAGRFSAVEPELARHVKCAVGLAVDPGDLQAVIEYEAWAQAASAASPQLREWVERFRRA